MKLVDRINADLKTAMLSRDEIALRGVRAIKAAILMAQTEVGANKELTPEKEIAILQKLVKQRRDSIAIFDQQNRTDLSEKEKEEVAIIEKYLPAQLSEQEITSKVKEIIASTGAAGMKDMGKVMGEASKALTGKADGSLISQIVKKLLV
jgi:uncharacterized protein YqeY